jgi:hypothetical protein
MPGPIYFKEPLPDSLGNCRHGAPGLNTRCDNATWPHGVTVFNCPPLCRVEFALKSKPLCGCVFSCQYSVFGIQVSLFSCRYSVLAVIQLSILLSDLQLGECRFLSTQLVRRITEENVPNTGVLQGCDILRTPLQNSRCACWAIVPLFQAARDEDPPARRGAKRVRHAAALPFDGERRVLPAVAVIAPYFPSMRIQAHI